MSPEKQRRTFLSYSRINKDFALKLARELKSSGFPVWIDQLDIPTGARWDDELEKALDECDIFMVILTPASTASDNVKDEIGYAIDTGKRILPILLENANVPLRLRRFQYVDFSNKSYEEGVESAKILLRNLTDTPTIPLPKMPPETESASKPVSTPMAEKSTSTPAVVPVQKASSSKGLVIGVGVVVGIGVLVGIIILALSLLGGNKASSPPVTAQVAQPTSQPAPTKQAEQPTSAPAPTKTAEPAANKVAPTDVPASPTATQGPQKYATEDFNGDLSAWTTFVADHRKDDPVISSEPLSDSDVTVSVENGFLLFDIQRRLQLVYSIYDAFQYSDVRVDVHIDSRNINPNIARLICRYSKDGGWYEVSITNNGLYDISFAKPNASGLITYRSLANGGSDKVNMGNAANDYAITCQGNAITLYINGELVKTTTDDLSVLRTGKIGVGVSSFNGLPVVVGYDWVKTSEAK